MIIEITGVVNGIRNQPTGKLIEISDDIRLVCLTDGSISFTSDNYSRAWYKGKSWSLGRLIYHLLDLPLLPNQDVDHKDRDLNNYKTENLRAVSKSINGQNRGKNKNNKSGYKCISWSTRRQKWRAHICKDKKLVWDKFFDNIETAIKARKYAFSVLFPGLEYVE